MKKIFTINVLTFLIFSCSNEDASLNNNSVEKIYSEFSYIINGERKNLKIDLTDAENAIVVKTEESDLILSFLDKENLVFYYNPEIEDIALFEDFNKFSSFINDETQVKALKNKFKSKITSNNNGIVSKSMAGPISGAITPSVTVYENSNYNGISFSFLVGASASYYYANSNLGNTSIGHDRTSSIDVKNAYVGFWEHPDFIGKVLIVDSYNYHTQIANLKDAKFNSFTIINGSSSSSNRCGWLCGSHWNDRFSSTKARGNGSRIL